MPTAGFQLVESQLSRNGLKERMKHVQQCALIWVVTGNILALYKKWKILVSFLFISSLSIQMYIIRYNKGLPFSFIRGPIFNSFFLKLKPDICINLNVILKIALDEAFVTQTSVFFFFILYKLHTCLLNNKPILKWDLDTSRELWTIDEHKFL